MPTLSNPLTSSNTPRLSKLQKPSRSLKLPKLSQPLKKRPAHMKQQRLDGLADGIFAIVMTFLAFEFKIPTLPRFIDEAILFTALKDMVPTFLSFIMSFALLFTYWRAHHYITSVYSKTLTVYLACYNALFFLLIILVPFSTSLLGEFPNNKVAVMVYGLNIVLIGLSLFFMRRHIEKDTEIETSSITKADKRSGYIRILFPVATAIVAIFVASWSPVLSKVLFILGIVFNLVPSSTNIIHVWLDKMFSDDDDIIPSNHRPVGDEFSELEEGD